MYVSCATCIACYNLFTDQCHNYLCVQVYVHTKLEANTENLKFHLGMSFGFDVASEFSSDKEFGSKDNHTVFQSYLFF